MAEPYDLNDTVNAARDVMALLVNPDADHYGAYALPDDIDTLTLKQLPVFVVTHDINMPMAWSRHAAGKTRFDWYLEIWLFLQRGICDTRMKAAQANKKHGHWLRVVGGHLAANMDLGVPQTRIGGSGTSSAIYTPDIGNFSWSSRDNFWGIRFIVPVVQFFSQPTSRSSL